MENIKPSQAYLNLGKMEQNFALSLGFGGKMTVWNLCEMIEVLILNKDLFITSI